MPILTGCALLTMITVQAFKVVARTSVKAEEKEEEVLYMLKASQQD